jgi:hypothetical protein
MSKPLFSATVGGRALRFFKPPDGGPDFPWHSVDDLGRCLGLNRAHRKILHSKYLRGSWPKGTVAVGNEIITIAPHFVAQGSIDAMVEVGQAPASVRIEYDRAATDAMISMPLPFAFGTSGWAAWMKAAMNRHENGGPPESAEE